MANIAQKSNIPSNGAFTAIVGSVLDALQNIDKVLISQGAANAQMRKVEMLNAKSDEELAKMGLDREDIISVVFGVKSDTEADLTAAGDSIFLHRSKHQI